MDFLDSDLDYIYGGYVDTYFKVYEIHGEDEVEVYEHINLETSECRETCLHVQEVDEDIVEGSKPIVTYHAAEKGTFGDWYIELEDDIEIDKITLGTVKTYIGEFVENLYYNGNLLQVDHEWSDTYPKHEEAYIGWLNS